MPIKVVFEPQNNLMVSTFSGKVSPEDILQSTLWEHKQPQFRPGMNSLVDLTETELTGVNFNVVHQYSQYMPEISQIRGHCRWALVSPKLINYGLLRMFSLINQDSPIQIEVFKSLTKGRNWLLEGRQ